MYLYPIYEYYWPVNDRVKKQMEKFKHSISILHYTYFYISRDKIKYLPFEFSYYYDNMILQKNSNYLEQDWNKLGVLV